MELTDKEYINELELSLIFLCECYVSALDSVAGCREKVENGKITSDERYTDLFFHFPMIQGQARFAVQNIAELRTIRGNREGNKMSMQQIFERMKKGRKTEREIDDRIRKVVENQNNQP